MIAFTGECRNLDQAFGSDMAQCYVVEEPVYNHAGVIADEYPTVHL